ncbi:MAG TPA: [Fe-Fe] hydrogenase large subunit C-terminal domain-containing protein [Halanaerobiales bacterium]|nr:[Fe-Fe] hydrogenase large subunit C-terminal domain-containing protein [Halanaerobiales bacterium]
MDMLEQDVKELIPVITVDEETCVNCHRCIAVCPVMANDGSGDSVVINHNQCIACGQCIEACTHSARGYMDDFSEFMESLKTGEDIVAIVAPAAAANFPDQYLNLNTWLKEIGIKAVFDVSFGAELTVKSYMEYIKKNNPECVIAQPCPAIVTYIEIYFPELLKYLIPVDSPMLHTMKMIKRYYTEYENHKILVVSPCLAKKREFEETGYGDFNVTYKSLKKHFNENNIRLKDYPKTDFDNPSAERAVLFSFPGGLMRTALRENPDIFESTRKIEGVHQIYEYLKRLPEMIDQKYNPLLIDCLSCEMGCNGGPGTINTEKCADEIEFYIEKRNKEMKRKYEKTGFLGNNKKALNRVLGKYWEEDLYTREYLNLSDNNQIKIPDEDTINSIFKKMNKYSDEDIKDCNSCGYDNCREMAIAIYNDLNKPENCHWYQHDVIETQKGEAEKQQLVLEEQKKLLELQTKKAEDFLNKINNFIQNLSATLEELGASNELVVEKIQHTNNKIGDSTNAIERVNDRAGKVQGEIQNFDEIRTVIHEIVKKTNLLALNASIEASKIGAEGKGFMVVADEVRELAETSALEADKIQVYTDNLKQIVLEMVEEIRKVSDQFSNLNSNSSSIMFSSKDINNELAEINEELERVKTESDIFIKND